MANPSKSTPPRSTPVPPRGGARRGGPGGRPAGGGPVKGGQARQAQHRRNRMLAWGAVVAVVVVVAALIGVKLAGGGGSGGAARQPAPASAVSKLTTVPVSTLVSAASKVHGLYPATAAGDPPLTSGGKPELLYIGAEFCPICATERWPMTVALSHFGTFTNLQQTHSAVTDGNIPTLSYYGSTFTSPYLTFTPVENTTNQRQGNGYKPLQQPTAAEQALWLKHSGNPPSYPFVDIGGKVVLTTSQFPDTVVQGHSFSDIVSAVGSNNNTLGASIDASAAVLTRYICSITNQQPAQTCSAVANVALPSSTGANGSSTSG